MIGKRNLVICLLPILLSSGSRKEINSWIRINQLGYTIQGIKAAVWCSQDAEVISNWELVSPVSGKTVATGTAGKNFGTYGPFKTTYRLDFTFYQEPGKYFLRAGRAVSPVFDIGDEVYRGAADFCLRYMRQQRSGFNPFLKDSCHTHDGYVLYGASAGLKDSTYIDVTGGWHDASDYLQYASTSANATYHLLAAYRDFPDVFTDTKQANGLDGANGIADVLDEAKWGLDWLLKMHPRKDRMFNQVGDDRDHMGMRIPKEDTNFYGRGLQRPVYFLSGKPQQRGKFMNNTTGTSSTAAKFSSAFSLGNAVFGNSSSTGRQYNDFSDSLYMKAASALQFALSKTGVSQTASVKSPYIYAEENWTDDMELGFALLYSMQRNRYSGSFENLLDSAYRYALKEKTTPWLGKDTAAHYQWYPFINAGHYELARQLRDWRKDSLISFYREGIQLVWEKAGKNAFYRGIPFIWCSNNLTTSFAIQCNWYKQLSGDRSFEALEQANIDWLFGCNPWGTSMVYGLPSSGDTPVDPHSAFTHLKGYPIDGGMVDGPVYTSIYRNLIGITLYQPDEYEAFQSDLAVYHDDYGDYSTNEPTMDGTASLIYLLAAKEAQSSKNKPVAQQQGFTLSHGAIIRGDTGEKRMALVFTGHEFAEGLDFIAGSLKTYNIKASFFFTGDFYRNKKNVPLLKKLEREGHYLGAHSDKHLLYCDWQDRNYLLIDREKFMKDVTDNYIAIQTAGISLSRPGYFLPAYEWYNDSIAAWTGSLGLQLICNTPGTLSQADYTTPADPNYRTSAIIHKSILGYEQVKPAGLNGFLLLLHAGAGPGRTDKYYKKLPELITYLKQKNYHFQTVGELLKTNE